MISILFALFLFSPAGVSAQSIGGEMRSAIENSRAASSSGDLFQARQSASMAFEAAGSQPEAGKSASASAGSCFDGGDPYPLRKPAIVAGFIIAVLILLFAFI